MVNSKRLNAEDTLLYETVTTQIISVVENIDLIVDFLRDKNYADWETRLDLFDFSVWGVEEKAVLEITNQLCNHDLILGELLQNFNFEESDYERRG
jgi:hypothetical protein